MKWMDAKRLAATAMVAAMTVSLAACGTPGEPASKDDSAKTETESESKDNGAETNAERPEAVSEEDWEAMQKEPVFGTEINYLFTAEPVCLQNIWRKCRDTMKSTVSMPLIWKEILL